MSKEDNNTGNNDKIITLSFKQPDNSVISVKTHTTMEGALAELATNSANQVNEQKTEISGAVDSSADSA